MSAMEQTAKIKPTPQQLEFLSWEMGAFFHFGIRTFYEGHRDWDGKSMSLEGFNPTELDCNQWISTIKEAGCTYAILVCKHHDGFANWPSQYSDFSVAQTPWKDGNGDVVQEFVDACRAHDIKIGLYYSPAEAGFKELTPKEYDDYFVRQISELLTNYGTIDYLWFDGNGSEGHEYDTLRIIKEIRTLQPEILIFNMWDPDTRWIGNEGGLADVTNSNVVSSLPFSTLAEEKDVLDTQMFLPAECDFMIRDRNWFYSEYDVHTVKSVEELVGIYYYSVGNGANFLINIGPDRRGLLPGVDSQNLLAFGKEIRRRFSNPIPTTVTKTETGLTIDIGQHTFVNHLILSEDITQGESILEFKVNGYAKVMYRPACIHTGTTIGHKRIITFPTINASKIEVEITKSRGEYTLNPPAIFYIK